MSSLNLTNTYFTETLRNNGNILGDFAGMGKDYGVFGSRRSDKSIANKLEGSWKHPTNNESRVCFRRQRVLLGRSNRRAPERAKNPLEEPDGGGEPSDGKARLAKINKTLRSYSQKSLDDARTLRSTLGREPAEKWEPRIRNPESVWVANTMSRSTSNAAGIMKNKLVKARPKTSQHFGGDGGFGCRMEQSVQVPKIIAASEPIIVLPEEYPTPEWAKQTIFSPKNTFYEPTNESKQENMFKTLHLRPQIFSKSSARDYDDSVHFHLEKAIYEGTDTQPSRFNSRKLPAMPAEHLTIGQEDRSRDFGVQNSRLSRVRMNRKRIQGYIDNTETASHQKDIAKRISQSKQKNRYDDWVNSLQAQQRNSMYSKRRVALGTFSPLLNNHYGPKNAFEAQYRKTQIY